MYINFKYLESKGITSHDLITLQICKQQKFEDLKEVLQNHCGELFLQNLEEKGLVKFIKAGKTIFEKARTTEKGNQLLENVEITDIEEEDLVLFNWAKGVYEKRNKDIGNAKKTKTYIALFRVFSGIYGNNLAKLIKAFLDDKECQEYSHRLEYVFFKPPNAFQTKFDLENSKLWQYYLKNKIKFNIQLFDK